MAGFPEAEARLYKDFYVCRKCETRTRIPVSKVLVGKGSCRKCSCKAMRAVRKRAKK